MSAGEEALAFQLKAAKIRSDRQVRPNPDRKWTCDFFIPDGGFYVEVEGGNHTGGHKRGAAADTDYEKFNWCAWNNVCVLRFSTGMVDAGRALATIENALGR